MSLDAVSPLLLERYELKYLIPVSMIDVISKDIEGHCSLDYYSQISPQNSYVINSLYFDTPNFMFIRFKQNGVEPSYSFRVRSYGSSPKPPYYSEIKFKKNDFSNKMRAQIASEDWADILLSGTPLPEMDAISKNYFEKFASALLHYQMEPKILTQYRRKAYISNIDHYARVTFDRDLRYQLEENWNLKPNEESMCHYDHEDMFPHPEDNVILELKAEKKIPLWMIDLIRKHNLTRHSFSKFGSAMLETRSELVPPFDLISAFR